MKSGDTVQILPSYALNDMGLSQLAGTAAEVIEIVKHNGTIKGCWVKLPSPFMNEQEWFIPYSSVLE